MNETRNHREDLSSGLRLIREVTPVDAVMYARRREKSRRLLGFASMLFGCISALAVSIMFGFYLINTQHTAIFVIVFFMLFGVTPVLLWGGMCLAAPSKRLVLFLRRFSRSDIARAVTHPIETRLYRKFRLLTLQDPSVKPLGVSMRSALSPIAVTVAPLSIVLALLIYIVYSELRVPAADVDLITAIMYINVLFASLALVPLLGFFLVGLVIAVVVRILSNRKILLPLETVQSLERVRAEVYSLRKWYRKPLLAAPRCTIIKCSDTIWQDTVVALAKLCDVIVVGVSEPSDNLVNEINLIMSKWPDKIAFVGHRTELELREQLSRVRGEGTDIHRSLVTALNNRPVLTYDDPVSPDFTRNLGVFIENNAVEGQHKSGK